MKKSIKQVIVVRGDLKMRKGKAISQGSHASIAFLITRLKEIQDGIRHAQEFMFGGTDFDYEKYLNITPAIIDWMRSGSTKIVCQVHSEEELLTIYHKAKEAKLEVHLITDLGKTEFAGIPTKTCLAIGPDEIEKIDKITGSLELY